MSLVEFDVLLEDLYRLLEVDEPLQGIKDMWVGIISDHNYPLLQDLRSFARSLRPFTAEAITNNPEL